MALTALRAAAQHAIARAALWAIKGGYYQATLTGGVTLDTTYPLWIGLDPGGAGRTIVLDGDAATDSDIHGLFRIITNRADAAENLTVNDAAAATIGTISQNETGVFYHDEDAGWTLLFIITGALS